MNPGIGLNDFYPTLGAWSGPGSSDYSQMEALQKSLAAGSATYNFGTVAPGNGASIRAELVEGAIKAASFLMRHLKMYTRIPKQRSSQIEHQWVERSEYGQNSVSTTFDGINTPTFTDATNQRRRVVMKYRSTGRAVTPQMRVVDVVGGDPVAQEMVNGTMFMMGDMENALHFGNDVVNPLEWKGLEQQITDGLVASIPSRITESDLRGASLQQFHIENSVVSAAGDNGFGMPNEVHLSLQALSKYNNVLNGNGTPTNSLQRIGLQGDHIIQTGTVSTGQVTTASEVVFVPNLFIDRPNVRVTDWNLKNPSGIAGTIPASPTVGAPTFGAAGARAAWEDPGLTPLSQFSAVNGYFYWVAAVGQSGASAAVAANVSAVASVSGQVASITVTPNGANLPIYYLVFRTRADDTDTTKARAILRVPNTAGAGATTITDRNDRIPGCTTGFVLEMVPENIALLEILPLSRTPLYDQSLLTKWALVQFGTPVVRLTLHCNILRNIDTRY